MNLSLLLTIWLIVSISNIIFFKKEIFKKKKLSLWNRIVGIIFIIVLGPLFIPLLFLIIRCIENVDFDEEKNI